MSDCARHRAERDNRVSPDHLPACGRCGDLAGRGETHCAGCGAKLLPGRGLLAAAKRAGAR